MIVIVANLSKKKAFRRTKRLVSEILPQIELRTNIGNIPKRVLFKLIKNLRIATTKGVCIRLFFEDSQGFRGFKCIEFGKKSYLVEDFVNAKSILDIELKAERLV